MRKLKYDNFGQFNQRLTDKDIAYIALSIPNNKPMTKTEMQIKYKITEWESHRVKQMAKDKLKTIQLIKQDITI